MRVAAESPAPPRLPEALEAAATGAGSSPDGWFERELIDADLSARTTPDLQLDAVRLTRVDVSGSRLDRLRAVDGQLVDCNLANVKARRAVVSRVSIDRTRLTGITLGEAEIHDLGVRDCRVDLASFGSCRLARVRFEKCLMAETTFIDAQLDSVAFDECDLTRADFRGARLRRCEFRRCDLTRIEGVVDLRGAAIDWPTIVGLAGVWAAALGIVALDEG